MSGNNNIQGLFDVSGNLTVRAMERYISGGLSHDERAIVEKHLDENPFDREALEGLRSHNPALAMREISELKQRVLNATFQRPIARVLRISPRTFWYAAAGLAGIISLAMILLFLFREPVPQNQLAVSEPDKEYYMPPVTQQAEQKQSVSENDAVPVTKEIIKPETPASVDQVREISIVEDDVVVNEMIIDQEASQEAEFELPALLYKEESMADSTSIFFVVEQMPEFPGGEDSLFSFIARHLRYPQAAKESGIQGRVFVTFVVEKDGTVSDARILRGIGGGCDEEALRMVQEMPKWIPGKQRGKPIRVQYNLPIKFSLE